MVSAALSRWRIEGGDSRVLGVVRAAVGVLLLLQAFGAARSLQADGYFGDHFHLPLIAPSLGPPRSVYAAMLALQLLLAAAVIVGRGARPALLVCASIGIYLLLCDRLQFHHNRYALFCYAWLLSFSPCDQNLVAGRPSRASPAHGPLWAARLMQLQCILIYLGSGGSKLLDPDWRGGLVLFDRFARYGEQALSRGVPPSLVEALSRAETTSLLAKIAIATELGLAVGLMFRRTRVVALWWGVWFHLTIEVTSKVEGFTWLTLAAYALFATHDGRARKLRWNPASLRGRACGRLIMAIDWLSRFDARAWTPDSVASHHAVVIVDRDGARHTGLHALTAVARTCPLLFPMWGPLALVSVLTRRAATRSWS